MNARGALLVGVVLASTAVSAVAQTATFHTDRPIEFRLAEEQEGPGLTAARVQGENRTIYVHPEVQLDDRDIREASVGTDSTGQPSVEIRLTLAAVRKFMLMVEANQFKILAIAANNKVIAAPTISGSLRDDVVRITGALTSEEAAALVRQLSK